jgi:hypothetical protein
MMVGAATISALSCIWLTLTGRAEVGACLTAGVVGQIREAWAEAAALILALLYGAARGPPGPPTPPPSQTTGQSQ